MLKKDQIIILRWAKNQTSNTLQILHYHISQNHINMKIITTKISSLYFPWLCLFFWELELEYAYKHYAYKKKD